MHKIIILPVILTIIAIRQVAQGKSLVPMFFDPKTAEALKS